MCKTKFCRNNSYNRTHCSTCRGKKHRETQKEKYCYNTLKHNAKRRGKVFTLTFEEFKEFCYKSDYIKGKGRSVESLTIDRIDSSKGYEIGNIQILTLSQNARKGKKSLRYDWETRTATTIQLESPFDQEEDPDWLQNY